MTNPKELKGLLNLFQVTILMQFILFCKSKDLCLKGDGKMHAEAAVSMMLESNLKHSQLRTINRYFKHASRVNLCAKRRIFANQSIHCLSLSFNNLRNLQLVILFNVDTRMQMK